MRNRLREFLFDSSQRDAQKLRLVPSLGGGMEINMEKESYGSLVKNLRIANGLTKNQVAKSLGVTPGYISNVENNRTAMSLRMLTYYARLIGCSLDELVGELEPEYTETALDRKLYQAMIKLDTKTKEKLLKTIELWTQ